MRIGKVHKDRTIVSFELRRIGKPDAYLYRLALATRLGSHLHESMVDRIPGIFQEGPLRA